MNYSRLFTAAPVARMKTSMFGGIQQAADENDMQVSPKCYTPTAMNFWIDNGNLTVRHNYEPVTTGGISDALGHDYVIKSMFVYVDAKARTPHILLAGCEVYADATHTHKLYCCLMKRLLDFSDDWTEVKGSPRRSFAAGQPFYFQNADFTFRNYDGDFYEDGSDVSAAVLVNGADIPMFFTPDGLSYLKSDGWFNVTVSLDGNIYKITADISNNVVNGDTLRLFSRTKDLPAGIASGISYYVRDAANSGSNTVFCVSAAAGGNAITGGSIAAVGNVMVRVVSDTSPWLGLTADYKHNLFTAQGFASNGDLIEFQSISSPANLPKGIAAGKKYYVVGADAATGKFSISATSDGKAMDFTSNGSNVEARQINKHYDDAPEGLADLFIHRDRLWGRIGNTLYYSAGYYNDAAHPADWIKEGYAGNIPIPTWDGDTINVANVENGQPWVCKEHSVWSIDGYAPPYTVRQIFTATGTISPRSVVWYAGSLIYAAEEGMLQFDGAAARPFLTEEIRKLWYPRNTSCICSAMGNTLFIHGQFYHPFDVDVTGKPALGAGLLMVDIPTRNICYQDMTAESGTKLDFRCVLDPIFTTLQPNAKQPFLWFTSGSRIYRYSMTVPEPGVASALRYCFPQTDYGAASYKKDVTMLTITGSGGGCRITPVVDGIELTSTPYPYTVTLPAEVGVVETFVSGVTGRRIGWIVENLNGSAIVIRDMEVSYGRNRD